VAHNLLGFIDYGARRFDAAAAHFTAEKLKEVTDTAEADPVR